MTCYKEITENSSKHWWERLNEILNSRGLLYDLMAQ